MTFDHPDDELKVCVMAALSSYRRMHQERPDPDVQWPAILTMISPGEHGATDHTILPMLFVPGEDQAKIQFKRAAAMMMMLNAYAYTLCIETWAVRARPSELQNIEIAEHPDAFEQLMCIGGTKDGQTMTVAARIIRATDGRFTGTNEPQVATRIEMLGLGLGQLFQWEWFEPDMLAEVGSWLDENRHEIPDRAGAIMAPTSTKLH
jgi:hypothetical protein